MIKKKTVTPATPPPAPVTGLCVDCAHGYVMSDGTPYNPLVTECAISKIRYSQSTMCCIGRFEARKGELEVHEMVYLTRNARSKD